MNTNILIRFIFAFFTTIALFASSCTDLGSKYQAGLNTATDAERQIDYIFQSALLRDGLLMDSFQFMVSRLNELPTSKTNYLSKVNLIRATYYRRSASFELAKSYYRKSLEYLIPGDSLLSYAYEGLGISEKHLGNFSASLKHFQGSISNAEKRKDTLRLATAYASIAQLHFEKQDSAEAKEAIRKVVSLYKNRSVERPYLVALHTLANIEGQSGNFSEAMKIDKEGIALSEKMGNEYTKITFQDNLARCYLYFLKDYDKAKLYFSKNLAVDKKLNNLNWIADSYINLAEVAIASKNFTEAKAYLDSALSIAINSKQINNTLKVYSSLVGFYKQQDDYKNGFNAQEKFIDAYKSFFNEKSEQAFVAYNVIYETEKKEREIAEAKIASEKKNIWLIALSGLILLGLVVFWAYKLKIANRQKRLLLENELLIEQAHSRAQQERLEISKDLHDSLGAQLTFINSVLDKLRKQTSTADYSIREKVASLYDFSENSIAELRNILWVLNSEEIRLSDLKMRLLNFIKAASEAGEEIKFNFKFPVSEDINLNFKQAVHLYRVFQEIVNNAVKYSKAPEVNISMVQDGKKIMIQVVDNGTGFDYETEKNKSFGLQNIFNRIAAINGKIDLKTAVGEGTVYNIQIVF